MDILMKRLFKQIKRQKIPEQKQLDFLKQLHRLLVNGYSLLDALDMFQWDRFLRDVSHRLIAHLKSGTPIDEAFKKEGFHPFVTTLLYFVRIHGDLTDSLEKCISMLDQRLKALRKFQQTLRYPLILFVFFIGLLISIKQVVLPSFINLYESQGNVSPMLNLSLFFIKTFFSSLLFIILMIICSSVFWLFYKRNIEIDQLFVLYKKIPIVRRYQTIKNSYHFAVHFNSLLKTGLSPVEILNIIKRQQEVPLVAHMAHLAIEQLLQGFNLGESVRSLILIDEQLSYIFSKNLNMDTLEADLNMYIEMSQEILHDRIMRAIRLIQPVFLFIIASFIIFIYVTLMWPMFQLIQTF